jgi:hypothetical protein
MVTTIKVVSELRSMRNDTVRNQATNSRQRSVMIKPQNKHDVHHANHAMIGFLSVTRSTRCRQIQRRSFLLKSSQTWNDPPPPRDVLSQSMRTPTSAQRTVYAFISCEKMGWGRTTNRVVCDSLAERQRLDVSASVCSLRLARTGRKSAVRVAATGNR